MSEIYHRMLSDDELRSVLQFCVTPKSTQEIIEYVFEGKQSRCPSSYHRIGEVQRLVASTLSELEQREAIVYCNDKWKTTEGALSVLKKYFGVKAT